MPDFPDEPVTADDIEEAAAQAALDGVASFSDGTNSVTAIDPIKQFDMADRVRRTAAASDPFGTLQSKRLIGGEGWQ